MRSSWLRQIPATVEGNQTAASQCKQTITEECLDTSIRNCFDAAPVQPRKRNHAGVVEAWEQRMIEEALRQMQRQQKSGTGPRPEPRGLKLRNLRSWGSANFNSRALLLEDITEISCESLQQERRQAFGSQHRNPSDFSSAQVLPDYGSHCS
jgi:hypothetical protein